MNKEIESFNGKTILVVGGNGFIGSNFIRFVFSNYPEARIVNIDKNTYAGNPENLDDIRTNSKKIGGKYDYIEQRDDIANPDINLGTVFMWWKPDFVVNFAAESHVDRSIHGKKDNFIKTNIIGVYNLLEAIKGSSNVKKFIQISTDEVYGQLQLNETEKKFTPTSPINPSSLYSATKASGDLLCNAYYHTWGVPVIVTRCSNNYGPYQYPEKLIPHWVMLLSRGEKMPLYGDGLNVRDWIHVDDHVRAIEACLLRGKPGEVYNIGANNERSNLEIAKLIIKIIFGEVGDDWNIRIKKVEDRLGHDRRYAIDNTGAVNELGWNPVVTSDKFEEKLKETVLWYLNNSEWVDKSIKRINK